MLKKQNPTKTPAWQNLKGHFEEMRTQKMIDLFEKDSNRFEKFSIRFEDLLLDFSKNLVSEKTISLLLDLAKECGLNDAIEQMFSGEKINETEDRAVLHIALRNRSNTPIFVDGKNVMEEVQNVLEQVKTFSNAILEASGKAILVNPFRML